MEKPFAAYLGDEPYIFVCYAHEDRKIVYPEMVWLREQGANLWYDEGISAGKNWLAVIGDSLLGAASILFYISERSLKSDHCNREINLALSEGKGVVPIYLEDVELTSDLKVGLSRVQALYRGKDANYQQHLLSALGQTVEADLPSPNQKTKFHWPPRGVQVGFTAAILLGVSWWYWEESQPSSPIEVEQTASRPATAILNSAPKIRVPLPLDGWEDWKVAANPTPSMVISPDGKTVVFVARDSGGISSLRVRRLEGLNTIELAGTEGAEQPFFSPDGRWIGYFDSGLMKRLSLSGGDPSIITNVKGMIFGASWGPDDRIYYAEGRSGLKSVSISGGNHQVVTRLNADRLEGSHRLPHYIPGQQVLLLSIFIGSPQKHETWALNLVTGEFHFLFDGLAPTYIDSGHIVFALAEIGPERSQEVMGGSLWAVPFDAVSMALTGAKRLVQNAVAGREGTAYAVARSGPLIYLPKQGETVGELVLLESNGSRMLAQGPMFQHPQFSNDGKSIAVTATEEGKTPSIRIYGIESGAMRQFSEGARFPLWDPDDQGITFMKIDVGLVRQRLDGAKPVETVVRHERMIVPDAWINKGQTLVYHAVNPETNSHVYTLEFGNEPRKLFTPGVGTPNITVDQQWVAFCTWPHGVYVGSFPHATSLSIVTDSGCTPHWGAGDTRLYYQNFNRLWAVNVNIAQGIVFGERELITDLGYPGISLFDIDKIGRIVFARHTDTAPKPPVLMMNWASMLN